ncbi:hypothetical protein [Desnuesiella massiliensis]|uniref:hypothetical protein n=1 Tax=Desnuesiella massiliensis TaxID=1650662 RepID=UPI0006E2172B|nr:hypothetical protein [Desnuesiella massiliensis]
MKYKKIFIVILAMSILLNCLQFYNNNKYKGIIKDKVQYDLSQVFVSSGGLNLLISTIVDKGETNKLQLREIDDLYKEVMIHAFDLRGLANKYRSRNEVGNFQNYAFIYSDITRYIKEIKSESYESKILLKEENIKFLNKLSHHLNGIEEVHKKYSYVKDGNIYYKLEQWIDIVSELGRK